MSLKINFECKFWFNKVRPIRGHYKACHVDDYKASHPQI